MTSKDFAIKMARISIRQWNSVLAGTRNLSYRNAKRVAGLLGTSVELWVNPEASPRERRGAWELFRREAQK